MANVRQFKPLLGRGLGIFLLLAATVSDAQIPVPAAGGPIVLMGQGDGRRGDAWCAEAQGASLRQLAVISADSQGRADEADANLRKAQAASEAADDAARRSASTLKQREFELARLRAAIGLQADDPARVTANRTRDAADMAFATRRGLVARVTRLREESAYATTNPDPTSNRTLAMIKRDLADAEQALRADEQASGSTQQLFDASQAARANAASVDARQSDRAIQLAESALVRASDENQSAQLDLREKESDHISAMVAAQGAGSRRDQARQCIAERRAILAAAEQAAMPPPAPGAPVTQLTDLSGGVSGVWASSCLLNGEPLGAPSGSFTMQFDKQGAITGAFVEGASSSITGHVSPAGQLQGQGSFVMDGTRMALQFSGFVSRRASGGLTAAGVFTNNDGQGVTCSGQWSG